MVCKEWGERGECGVVMSCASFSTCKNKGALAPHHDEYLQDNTSDRQAVVDVPKEGKGAGRGERRDVGNLVVGSWV